MRVTTTTKQYVRIPDIPKLYPCADVYPDKVGVTEGQWRGRKSSSMERFAARTCESSPSMASGSRVRSLTGSNNTGRT
jgi:hypothetical protein